MEPIPLIPKINLVSCPDTSHILKEEFQEFLEAQKFPLKIAENLHEFNSKDLQLKACGTEVVNNYNVYKINVEELMHAEEDLMTSQAKFLNYEPSGKHNFKLERIFPHLDKNVIDKYSLIEAEEIMPHITERILNSKMEPHEFIFQDACPYTKQRITLLEQFECPPCNYQNITIDYLKITASKQSKLNKIMRYNNRRAEIKSKCKHDYSKKQVFSVEPKEIEFIDYEKNILYEKQLKLRNISAVTQTFSKPILPPESKFSVRQIGNQHKLAPGMSAIFIITFITFDLSDKFEDVLIINVIGSTSIFVTLSCKRDTPIVKGLIYLEEGNLLNEIKKERDDVFNYTIDCGALLYGCSKEFKLTVQNFGGTGNFFILSEDDWVSGTITNITKDFKLVLQDFILYPAYFELKQAEIKEIRILFRPTQYGLCLDKIFLLCDSNNAKELDIIGDCIFYEPYYIKFEMPDCPLPRIKKTREPKNILHLGATYTNQTVSGIFKVHNTSTVPFAYEWRKNKYTKKQQFNSIQSNNVIIDPNQGIFPPVSEQEFQVTVHMSNKQFGLFKFAFSLYILDILENNLNEGPIYTYGEEYRNEIFEKCLTILINNVEIQIHHIPIQLYIYPEKITFSKLIYQTTSNTKLIKIVNEGFCCVSCEWIHDIGCGCQENDHNQISIQPNIFDLEANSFVDCTVSITPVSYNDIYETFVLSINSGFSAKTLLITGQVEKPQIKISHTFFDFGSNVKRGSHTSAEFYIENENDAQIYWRVQEYKYNIEMGYFVEIFPRSLKADCGCLCHKGSGVKLEYVLDTSRPRKFLSLLVFYTIFKSQTYESNHVILVANIVQPVVFIFNENNNENIFSIEEEYFVHETINRNFYLHNDSSLEVIYKWGEPIGYHTSFVLISMSNCDGTLYPWSRSCIQITITFLQPCYLHEVYVPCTIEALPDPIYLHICCTVKPPQIIISLPINAQKSIGYEDILWPSYEVLKHSEESIAGENQSNIEEFVPISENANIDNNLQIINYLPEYDDSQWYPNIISYLESIELDAGDEEMIEIQHTPINVTSRTDNSTEAIINQSPCLASVFTSSINLNTHYIEFRNLICRQVYKKTFELRNIMDIPINYNITVKNFKNKSLHRKRLDKILININWISDDKYSAQLSENGILVIVNPESGELKNKTTIAIEIEVYAETFGFYLEELAIEIDNLPIFYLNLFIQVCGLPIEFPAKDSTFDPSNITLRFGNFSVCSKPEKRSLYLRNNCTIPFKIVWHVFVKNIEDYTKGPINVAYDIFGFEDKPVDFKIRFFNYIGKECSMQSDLFEISSKELFLKPKETKSIQITLNSKYSHNINNFNVDAMLIGHIYLEEQYQIIKNDTTIVIRNPEKQLRRINVNLIANIDGIHVDLNCISGKRTLEVAISDYLIVFKDVIVNMRFVFKNSANFNMLIGVKTVEPFQIISIKSETCENTTPDINNIYTCLVLPNFCAEILVQCKIGTNMLVKITDVLYKNIPHILEDTAISKDNRVKITKPLSIYTKCGVKEEIPLSIVFIFPLTFVSEEVLNFGQVTVGTEKCLTLKLQNKTVSKTWFQTSFEIGKAFTVYPIKGYLDPMPPNNHFFDLIVTFRPKDVGDLEDNLKIITCLAHYEQQVKLTGTGTFNEKFISILKLKI